MKKTQGLRQAKYVADKAGAEARIVTMIEKQIKKEIDDGLEGITEALVKQYAESQFADKKGRVSELKNEGEKILKGLATRLDNGYQLEGDVGEVPEEKLEEGQEPNAEHAEKVRLSREVKKFALDVQYSDVPDEPVLHLPKPDGDQDDEDEDR